MPKKIFRLRTFLVAIFEIRVIVIISCSRYELSKGGEHELEYSNELFAANLRAERNRKSMSQDELAERAGVSRTSISAYETATAKPTLENAVALAIALGVTPNVLAGWE